MNRRQAAAVTVAGAVLCLVDGRFGYAAGNEGAVAPSAAGATATSVSATPAQQILTLGLDTGTMVLVTVTGADAQQAKPGRTQVTVGEIGPLVPRGEPGSFVAEYRLPQTRQPQSAIISVEVLLPEGRDAHATTHLMLPAATDFPLHSSPNAAVSLEIAGTVFGPRKADSSGNVWIPIVVPPGVATGLARAVNRFGVTNETEVDLQPQEYRRSLVVAPAQAEAGSPVDIEVWAVDVSGDPSAPDDIDLTSSAGKVRRLGGVPGVAIFSFTPPGRLTAADGTPLTDIGANQVVRMTAAMEDEVSLSSADIAIRPARIAALALKLDTPRLVVGDPAPAHLTVAAVDRFGNPVPILGLKITADGETLPAAVAVEDDRAVTSLRAPDAWRGRDHLRIAASLGAISSTFNVPLTGGPPARLTLGTSTPQIEADGTNVVILNLRVVDARGTPTPANSLAWHSDDEGTILPLPAQSLGIYAARFTPRRTVRDRSVVIAAVVEPGLKATTAISVQAGPPRTAAARIGVVSNFAGFFGQTAFVEATLPLTRVAGLGGLGRLLSAGLGFGYMHSELTTSQASGFPGVRIDVSQTPLLALGRLRLPGDLPVELSIEAAAGMTFAATAITPPGDAPFGPSRGVAYALILGGGLDGSVLLEPGELIIGARYLHASLGRDSNGDRMGGNSAGVICDLGFRLGF